MCFCGGDVLGKTPIWLPVLELWCGECMFTTQLLRNWQPISCSHFESVKCFVERDMNAC